MLVVVLPRLATIDGHESIVQAPPCHRYGPVSPVPPCLLSLGPPRDDDHDRAVCPCMYGIPAYPRA
jgi:hypothetical protein